MIEKVSDNKLIIRYFDVTENERGQRLDNYLFARMKNVPKSHIYRMIRRGEVRLNKGRCQPSGKLSPGDKIRAPLRAGSETVAVPPKLDKNEMADVRSRVFYDDEFLLAVNKLAGEVIHSGSRHSYGLVDQLNQIYALPSGIKPLHRLDRGTTGCVVFAKSRPVMVALHQAFREHQVKKTYLALVAGRWDDGVTRVVSSEEKTGKRMETEFRVLSHQSRHTLLEVCPLTGRKHQIRKQTATAGHPIIGDRLYGRREHGHGLPVGKVRRLFLHAWKLSFSLQQMPYSFMAPPPSDWCETDAKGMAKVMSG